MRTARLRCVALEVLAASMAAMALISGGCSRAAPPEESPSALLPARLAGLRRSTHPELQRELQRLAAEKALPDQLRSAARGESNAAVALRRVFPRVTSTAAMGEDAALHGVASLAMQTAELFPPHGFALTAPDLMAASRLRRAWEPQRMAGRAALRLPHCDFGARPVVERGDHSPLAWLAHDLPTVRVLRRLEAFAAAELLDAGRLEEASEAVEVMLQYAALLAAEPHPNYRLEAVAARSEALQVLQAVVQHPQAGGRLWQRFYDTLAAQRSAWPSEAETWRYERALGLGYYELLRAGAATQLLTPAEREVLPADAFGRLFRPKADEADDDQWHYLQAMRKVVEQATEPFHQRRVFGEFRAIEAQRTASGRGSLLAARLLRDVEQGCRLLAIEQALVEGWLLALAAAAGAPPPDYAINPATGQRYLLQSDEERIVVWGVEAMDGRAERPIVIPRKRAASGGARVPE
jgi:hypothetical protein